LCAAAALILKKHRQKKDPANCRVNNRD